MRTTPLFRTPMHLLLLLVWLHSGCAPWVWTTESAEHLRQLPAKPLQAFLIAEEGDKRSVWAIQTPQIDDSLMTGVIRRLPPVQANAIQLVSAPPGQKKAEHRLLLHLPKTYAGALPDTAQVAIPLDSILNVEGYRQKDGMALEIVIGSVAGLIVVALLVNEFYNGDALDIPPFQKSNLCPIVYAGDTDTRILEGELFSGALHAGLERHDWLPMRHLQATDGAYRVVVANEAPQIQHLNLLQLDVIDHPAGVRVLRDKSGRLHTLADPRPPVRTDSGGSDAGPMETLDLAFARPAGARQAKLLIRAKNTWWLDAHLGEMLDLQRTGSQEALLERRLPLYVALETAGGAWQPVDWLHLAGPAAWKEHVVPLDLPAVDDDTVRIRLTSRSGCWEIDQVALDYSADQPVRVRCLSPSLGLSAADNAGLLADDGQYVILSRPGETLVARFPAPPPPAAGQERTLLLHGKGYYRVVAAEEGKWIRDFSNLPCP